MRQGRNSSTATINNKEIIQKSEGILEGIEGLGLRQSLKKQKIISDEGELELKLKGPRRQEMMDYLEAAEKALEDLPQRARRKSNFPKKSQRNFSESFCSDFFGVYWIFCGF